MSDNQPKPAKRQHFVARFYLRNFAQPILSDNLCVYDIRKRRWEHRTPDGVGWFPHLCSMIDEEGRRTDDFDRFLKLNVEDPAVPVLRKLAQAGTLDVDDRPPLAMFLALTAARSPELMKGMMQEYLNGLSPAAREKLDANVELWCAQSGRQKGPTSDSEFLKPSSFGAIVLWAQHLQTRLLEWGWHLVRTTRDRPFVTSDRPVFLEWDRNQDVRLVSFPLSSDLALLVISGGKLNEKRDPTREACIINRQTTAHAREFIVAWKEDFPGDECLSTISSLE